MKRALALLLAAAALAAPVRAADTVCANVKMEIVQELTLERQAFEARMRINNGFSTVSLENVKITVNFKDTDDNPVIATSDPNDLTATFFIRVDSLQNIEDIAGAGRVGPSTTADIRWLIIPAPGAAQGSPVGVLYFVGAELRYGIGGEEKAMSVAPDFITVQAMPELTLDYFLPTNVFGDDAFTPELEPAIPFALGLRVRNAGSGAARGVKIESAQPRIVENTQGLLVGFEILGTEVNGAPAPLNLLADFGNIPPGKTGVARWNMSTSLSGEFQDFSARFTHSDALGGQLTSLIKTVNAHRLVKDVFLDLPGRDTVRDFLADGAGAPRLFDSEGADAPVADLSAGASLTPQAGSGTHYALSLPPHGGYFWARVPDPGAGARRLDRVVRSDGKTLDAANAWPSKTRAGIGWDHWINVFDAGGQAYTVVYGEGAENRPPAIGAVPPISGKETEVLEAVVTAVDPEGAAVAWSAARLPAGAVFTDQGDGTARLVWTPAEGQAGRYEMVLTASDGEVSTEARAVATIAPQVLTLVLTDHPEWIGFSTPTWSWSALPGASAYLYSVDGTTPVATASTTHTASLPDGLHSFSVRAQFPSGSVSQTAEDIFGIDTQAPELIAVELNGGALFTENPLVSVGIADNGDAGGSGVVRREFQINEGSFTALSGDAVLLPAKLGVYKVSVRLADALGHMSAVKSATIQLTTSSHAVAGRSSSGDMAVLKDLRGPFSQIAPIIGGEFRFEGLPAGVYGLSVRSPISARAHPGRISLSGGAVFDAGAIDPGLSSATITGRVTPAVPDVLVMAGLNMGYGKFLELSRARTAADGTFAIPGLSPGVYSLYAAPGPAALLGPARAVAASTTPVEMFLSSASVVSGKANGSDMLAAAVGALGGVTPFSIDAAGDYAVALATGDYIFLGRTNAAVLDPVAVKVTDAGVGRDLILRAPGPHRAARLSAAGQILAATDPGVSKSFQLVSFVSQPGIAVPVMVARSEETAGDGAFHIFSATGVPQGFFGVLADDFDRDIHSVAAAPVSELAPNEFTVTGAGGEISGVVRVAAGPVRQAVVLLLDSTGTALGFSEAGPDGSFFIKHARPGSGLRVRAFDTATGKTAETAPFSVAEGGRVAGLALVLDAAPRVRIQKFPANFYAGQQISVKCEWAGLAPAGVLMLSLERIPTGTVHGVQTFTPSAPAGSAVLKLDVDRAAPTASNYRLRLTALHGGSVVAEDRSNSSITVKIDRIPPVLKVSRNQTLEATSVQGATAAVTATATDNLDPNPSVTGAVPAIFPMGTTRVTFTARDFANNTSKATVQVRVQDTTKPVLSVPPDVVAEATQFLTPVALGQATATDIFPVTVKVFPQKFAVGSHKALWTAIDANRNFAFGYQRVTVRDTTPPVLTVPADITVQGRGARTFVRIGRATAADVFPVSISNDSPALFPIGTTKVTWKAKDLYGNKATGTQTIRVLPPSPGSGGPR